MATILHRKLRAFSIIGVVIAITTLAVMAASLVVLVSTNQSTRTKQLFSDQAFYSANAGLEFALRQIYVDGNPNPLPERYFLGYPFDISRTCNNINVTGNAGEGASTTFSIGDPGQLCAISGSATPSSNSAPFNGQSMASGQQIWFSVMFTVSGLGSTLTHVYFENINVLFTANSVNYNIVLPSAIITFDPDATCVSTTYTAGQWHTTAPIDEGGSIFVSGVGFPIPVNLPGSISPVTMRGVFAADQEGLGVHWIWGAAVYNTSLANLPGLNVKASDKNTCNNASNDKAATPTNVKAYLTNGARSGGGSNYVGSGTGTTGTVVQCASSC